MNKLLLSGCMVSVILGAGQLFAQSTLSDVGQRVESREWQVRAKLFEDLSSKSILSDGDKEASVRLLSNEEALIARAWKSGPSVDSQYGEDYGEYVGQLTDLVKRIAEESPNRTDVWPVLVRAPFNSDSEFAAWLAKHPLMTADLLLESAVQDDNVTRANSISVLAQIVGAKNPAAEERAATVRRGAAIRRVVRQGLSDPDALIRLHSVIAMELIGTLEDVPLLAKIASADPEVLGEAPGSAEYSGSQSGTPPKLR